mgnify:CR=1 FL=1
MANVKNRRNRKARNKGLKKRMDMSAVQTVVRKNGADMQAKSQRNAPVDTGTLKRVSVLTSLMVG